MPKAWDKIASRITYADRWLTLHSHTYRLADGQVVEPFHVLERSDWVQIIALTDDRQVVLAREFRAGIGEVVTGLPGGIIDKADGDVVTAAARELREETGYECREWRPLSTAWANWANQSNKVSFVLGLGARLTSVQALDASEDISAVTMPWDACVAAAQAEPVQSFHLAALFLVEKALKA